MRTGRKRKSNVLRDASGKSRGERDIDVTTLGSWIHRSHLVGRQEAGNALAGFTLGVLRLNKIITMPQYDAGQAWANVCHRHSKIMGYSLGSPKSPSFMMVSFGAPTTADPDEDEIARVKNRWTQYYDALMAVCRDHGMRVRDVTYNVCVQNVEFEKLGPPQFGDLRLGLNALGRVR